MRSLSSTPRASHWGPQAALLALICGGGGALGAACVFTPPPPLPEELEAQAAADAKAKASAAAATGATGATGTLAAATGASGSTGAAAGTGAGTGKAGASAAVLASNKENGDPVDGFFTLEAALAGVQGEGTLTAEFVTPRGSIVCELYEAAAPITVANFAGLARGVRPFKDPDSGEWGTGAYYDNTSFHRVIPGFVIQGGDPSGTRSGNPGYTIVDELRPDFTHDGAGILSMANRGANTGGSQFFITLGPTPSLDGKHTVFGRCDEAGTQLADDISIVPRDASDKPKQDELVNTIKIYRR